ncbi:MAG: FAD-dependent oxidoreductase, partial [Candidatus Eisenbacteria bacterium]|nr:FAD-dependent oxidoreductase [Candidatus Latescibacterota bacterium]MBD3302473.1 FAD-dependent oxidoreductase [Candidatus Eisenbacteria bacterium]
RTALSITDAVGFDRNRDLPNGRAIPPGRILSREEVVRTAPLLDAPGITGGALWHDGLAVDTERLTLLLLKAAVAGGATVANRVEATGLLREGDRVAGIEARDATDGSRFAIRARVVLAATGGRIGRLLRHDGPADPPMALAMNLITRAIGGEVAFGVRSPRDLASDPIAGPRRFLFFVPWRGCTMIGTFYRPVEASDGPSRVTEAHLDEMLAEVNEALPRLGLSRRDVLRIHHGSLPRKGPFERGRPEALLQHGRVVDHSATDGIEGLLTLVGVKYTTARLLAAQAVDRVFAKLDRTPPRRPRVDPRIDCEEPDPLVEIDGATLENRLRHAIRAEMARTLPDLVLRRTGIGSAGPPDREAVALALRLLAEERDLDDDARFAEIEALRDAYRPLDAGAEWSPGG